MLTVATLNLRNRADRWAERRDLVVSQVVDSQPDLIALQEVHFPIGQGRWVRNQINIRLSGGTLKPYRLIQKRKRHLIKGYYEGIGILTKLPVLSHDLLPLGYGGRLALRANVALPLGQTLDFVCTHLHHEQHGQEARLEQVMGIMGWLNSSSRVPLQVVAGDFNEIPTGPAIQRMKQLYDSAYERVYEREPLATFPTALVNRPDGWSGCLDYIFITSALQVDSVGLFCHRSALNDDTLYPSDHVGLQATLSY